ncbi:RuvX/YqgF family protein [Patescibacteria group bacterium]|nr:RuvX/YqgF family protein [Patescibacteria group bacterium]
MLRLKGKKRGKVDDISAQIILQEYLDLIHNEN